jgi:hypothetical protein
VGVHSAYLPGLGSDRRTHAAQQLELGLSESELRESRKKHPIPRQGERSSTPVSPADLLDDELAALRRHRAFLRGADWLCLEAFHQSQTTAITPATATEEAGKQLSDAQRDFVLWVKLEDSARGAK